MGLEQFSVKIELLLLSLGVMLSIAFFNALGVSVTKYASAAQRTTIDTSRTLVVWLVFLLMPIPFKEYFHWLELVGFILLVLGTLVYNEILIVPFCGFNRNTKEAIARRQLEVSEAPG
mmetsp:Transcript_32668/g.31881  ORF Transcript_32668/g.31881 Transcript_32668/m.31881 type:complete len:118 (-) Transcript_32668:205-558(-)